MRIPAFSKGLRTRSWDDIIVEGGGYVFMTLTALVMLFPFLNIIAVSISSYGSYLKRPLMIIPTEFDFTAFKFVFSSKLLLGSYVNTIFIALVGTLFSLVLLVLTAYPLSRPQLRGKSIFMGLIIFTMMFNGGIIPNFLLIRNLGLLDSLWSIILTGAFSAFNVVLTVNFMKSMSEELIEAAMIDGASEPLVLSKVVVPLSAPILATMTLFVCVAYWNSYFSAVIYIQTQEKWPLQLLLREIVMTASMATINAGGNLAELDISKVPIVAVKYATLLVVIIPILCVYPFLQKYFVKGIMVGAVKG